MKVEKSLSPMAEMKLPSRAHLQQTSLPNFQSANDELPGPHDGDTLALNPACAATLPVPLTTKRNPDPSATVLSRLFQEDFSSHRMSQLKLAQQASTTSHGLKESRDFPTSSFAARWAPKQTFIGRPTTPALGLRHTRQLLPPLEYVYQNILC